MELLDFKTSCFNDDAEIVVQKHLIDGSSYFFDQYFNGSKEEFDFKKDLSSSFGVHIRDIVIVGSGKLGFSIKPDEEVATFYPFKKFDFDYDENVENERSDLDVAIVSSSLFDNQLLNIYNHTSSYTSATFKGGQRNSFAQYILKGWLRPDFVPQDYSILPLINSIQEKYRKRYERDVNIGIYKSWHFFENYHKNNITTIKLNLIAHS
ncbi:hypothetical protein [Flavisolibacter tropicus]|uniref:hypothetical protein n=1 Tax=Flavisolibacter tropicus TaxID=1492898 RepID=UPI0008303794|nr:hypothetical protein [Flavisolibacter tropicus]